MEFVNVAGVDYKIVKTGRAQAEQTVKVTKWLSRYGLPAIEKLNSDSRAKAEGGLEFVNLLIESLDADALLDLFTALVGCEPEVTEVHFDVAVLLDTVVEVYNNQPAVRKLIERFFSTQDSGQES
jgi:hypothetical protein